MKIENELKGVVLSRFIHDSFNILVENNVVVLPVDAVTRRTTAAELTGTVAHRHGHLYLARGPHDARQEARRRRRGRHCAG